MSHFFHFKAWRDRLWLNLLWLYLHGTEIKANLFALKKSLFFPISTVHATMKTTLNTLTSERERLKQCVDHETIAPTSPQVVGLKNALTTVCETTQTHTLTHKYSQSVEISIPPSYRLTSQKPAPLVRRDTLLSIFEGLLAAGVRSAHLNISKWSSCLLWLLPPTQRLPFSIFCFMTAHSLSCWLLRSFRTPVLFTPTHFVHFKYPAGC